MTDTEMLPNEAERNPIVRITDGEAMADSRDVAIYFGKEHKRVLQTIRELHCSDDFRRHHFVLREEIQQHSTGASKTTFVMMTKDGFAFLAMGFTGTKAAWFKERYIMAFNAMEAELRERPAFDPDKALNDPAWLRPALLAYTEKVIALEGKVEEMRPQVQALDRIAGSDGSFCITDAAKTLQVRPKDLFSFLRSHGWIYSRAGGGEIAYQSKLATGLLEHKTTTVHRTDGSERTVTQVRVTAKGLTRLAQEFPSIGRVA